MPTALIVLAAGQGTRMNSDLPKVLHELGGAPLFAHALASGRALTPARTVLVTGHGAKDVAKAAHGIDSDIRIAEQSEQHGTAHAVAQAQAALQGFEGDTVVLYGDTPFIRAETLLAMQDARAAHDIVVLGFHAAAAGRYGRLVLNGQSLERIVEFKDASPEERAISLCNSGVICASTDLLFDLVNSVNNQNASGEYYLTDIVGIARAREQPGAHKQIKRIDVTGFRDRIGKGDVTSPEIGQRFDSAVTPHEDPARIAGLPAINLGQ